MTELDSQSSKWRRLLRSRFALSLSPPVLATALAISYSWGLSGCKAKTTGPFEDRIVSAIQRCPTGRDCRIKLQDVTMFKWDRGYALYHGTKAQRTNILGTEDLGYVEEQRQIVFLNEGKIVFQETEPTDFEAETAGAVMFDCPESNGVVYLAFSPETVFSVDRNTGPNGQYYLLRPIGNGGS